MSLHNNIVLSEKKVKKHITAFILTYSLLIAAGILILVLAYYWATDWGLELVNTVYNNVNSGYIMLLASATYVGIIAVCLMSGLFLVKFLFARRSSEEEAKTEVKEEDCPQLFALIRETAEACNSVMPYKVYIDHQANAKVSFNTNFLSMFFPVKKNLTIGLGLLVHLNTEELQGVLAHEFGHFSQNSMKTGTAVYTANIVLYNLTYGEDAWDRWMERWANLNLWFTQLFAAITLWLTYRVKLLLQHLYNNVNLAQQELSRQMEYEADAVACSVVGKEVVISGLTKTDWTISMESHLQPTITYLCQQQKMANLFDIWEEMSNLHLQLQCLKLDAQHLAQFPLQAHYATNRRFTYEDPWDSHPSDEDRIKQLQDVPRPHSKPFVPAWSLIPQAISDQLSAAAYKNLIDAPDECQQLTRDDLIQWIKAEVSPQYLPFPLWCIFEESYGLLCFDPSTDEMPAAIRNPFSEEYVKTLYKHKAACIDANTMYEIMTGEHAVKVAYYQGKAYQPDNLPWEEHQQYIQSLQQQVKELYAQVYYFLTNNDQDKEAQALYQEIFSYRDMNKLLSEELPTSHVSPFPGHSESEEETEGIDERFAVLTIVLQRLREVIPQIRHEHLSQMDDRELMEDIIRFITEDLAGKEIADLSGDDLSRLHSIYNYLPQELNTILDNLCYKLGKVAQRILDKGANGSQQERENT